MNETYRDKEGYPKPQKYIIPDLVTGEEIEVTKEVYDMYCEVMEALKKLNDEE